MLLYLALPASFSFGTFITRDPMFTPRSPEILVEAPFAVSADGVLLL